MDNQNNSSLFEQNNIQQATPAINNPQNPDTPDPVATMLQSIKNEKGEPKYKTLDDALKALQHSQAYIPTLSDEKRRLEQELEQARLQASKVSELESTVAKLLNAQASTPTSATASVDPTVIEELVNRSITKARSQESAAQNTNLVIQTVASKFGDKAEEVFYGKATELGMSKAEFNQLAATRPKAVLSLLGIQDTVVPNQNSRQSTQVTALNTTGVTPILDTYIGNNKDPVIIGATTQQVREESARARKMVDELHAQGKTVHDLTDPKVYFKYFK